MRPKFYSDSMLCSHYDNLLALLNPSSYRYPEAEEIAEPPNTHDLYHLLLNRRTQFEPIINRAADSFPFRLGKYAESLIALALELQTPYLNMRYLCGLQIHNEFGATQGELDFIVARDTNVEHWELAVKYYLECVLTSGVSMWLGPQLKDALSLKLTKFRDQQVPLGQRYGQDVLSDFGGSGPLNSKLLVPGRRFYEGSHFSDGVWLRWCDFSDHSGFYCIVPRRCWINPFAHTVRQKASASELSNAHSGEQLMIGRVLGDVVSEVAFLVPDDWKQCAEVYAKELLREE